MLLTIMNDGSFMPVYNIVWCSYRFDHSIIVRVHRDVHAASRVRDTGTGATQRDPPPEGRCNTFITFNLQ